MVLKKLFLALSFLIGISIALIGHAVRAEVLFEGYSKVLSGGVHIGYSIARYEFDTKKKQFVATTFLKTNEFGGNLTESLKAYSDEMMKPVSYQYTTLIGNQVKTIDAQFPKGKISAAVSGQKKETISKDLPKGAFLSSFLAYVMLKSPQGLKSDSKYDFQAVAEEDAAVYKGTTYVKSAENYNGIKVLRVLNEFKGTKFISLVTERGEVISTKSPVQGIATELVAKPSEATAAFPIPTATLKTLFGDVPTGQMNEVSKRAQTAPAPTKQEGVPAGKGLQLKGGPAPTTTPPASEDKGEKK